MCKEAVRRNKKNERLGKSIKTGWEGIVIMSMVFGANHIGQVGPWPSHLYSEHSKPPLLHKASTLN